jgi:hypothetical protein
MKEFTKLVFKLAGLYSDRLKQLEKDDGFYHNDEENEEDTHYEEEELTVPQQHINTQIPKDKFIYKQLPRETVTPNIVNKQLPISREIVSPPIGDKTQLPIPKEEPVPSLKKKKVDLSAISFKETMFELIRVLKDQLATLTMARPIDVRRLKFAIELLQTATEKNKRESFYSIKGNLKDSPLRKQLPAIEDIINLL